MPIYSQEWLFYLGRGALLAAAMLVFAVALLRWRRAGTRDTQRILSELDESRQQARSLAELTQELGRQLTLLEAKLEDSMALAAAGAGGQQRGYDLALQMARNGSSVEEIVSASGVTRHEASFLAQLHNPQVT
ncbi:MAG: DUF2802 domain-containing protein [Steroidobacteraceae bacterium]